MDSPPWTKKESPAGQAIGGGRTTNSTTLPARESAILWTLGKTLGSRTTLEIIFILQLTPLHSLASPAFSFFLFYGERINPPHLPTLWPPWLLQAKERKFWNGPRACLIWIRPSLSTLCLCLPKIGWQSQRSMSFTPCCPSIQSSRFTMNFRSLPFPVSNYPNSLIRALRFTSKKEDV